MTYAEQYTLALTPTFRNRVGQALIAAARDVQAEAPATTNHTNRSNFARDVLRDPGHYDEAMSRAVCANVAITIDSIDSDIQFTVNSLWDTFAGIV